MQISKSLFELLADLQDSVVSLDSELNVTSVNHSQANLFAGTSSEKAIGKNLYEIAPQAADKIFNKQTLETIARKEIGSVEWQSERNSDLLRTIIFPAVDGVVIISRRLKNESGDLPLGTQARF